MTARRTHRCPFAAATLIVLLAMLLAAPAARGQIVTVDDEPTIDTDSVRRAFDSGPYFGLYKDNYFIFGCPLNEKPSRTNSNIKFQISIAQKLTRSRLPWNTYIYLFYTQKCFWNILENSMPMTDLNFNPGLGITKPLFSHGRYIGKLSLIAEHESNGRDSIWSRSWERLSIAANIIIDNNLMVHGKTWIPIVDGVNNRDLLRYVGIYQMGMQVKSNNGKLFGGVTLTKRARWNIFAFNTQLELGYRFNRNENQYLYVQYYNGYGEGLFEYKRFRSQLRVGIVIKPPLFSDF